MRPIEPGDQEALRDGFERLSERSRYLRFLTPMAELRPSQLRYLTEVDHHDHEALIAFDEAGGEGVGVARYVRIQGGSTAEAAVTVVDDWQNRGLGTALTTMLAERAREEGITAFVALLLAENTEMLDLLRRIGPTRTIDRHAGTIEIEVELPREGIGNTLRELLRAVARRPIELARPPGPRARGDHQ